MKNKGKICFVAGCNNDSYIKGLCCSHYSKKWRNDNPDKVKAIRLRNKQNNYFKNKESFARYAASDKGRFNKAKKGAKCRDLEFNLSFEEFVTLSSKPCYYCNDELCSHDEFRGAHLDRIDNNKGYLADNVVSCGFLCNKIRLNNLTVDEAKDAINGIINGRKRRAAIT
jgi:hypothetical protein